MDRIIEQVKRGQGEFVPVLDSLGGLLETREHGPLAAGEMLAGVAVLADLGKDLLHEDELIRHEGEVFGKLGGAGEALDIQDGIVKAEQITQDRIVVVIDLLQFFPGLVGLQKDTLLDDLIRGRGREGQAGFEAGLNAGELIFTGPDNLVNGLLAGADHPDLAPALAADFLDQGLEVHEQIGIAADILADLVDHEEQAEVIGLGVHIFLDLGNELRNGGLDGLVPVEPVEGGLLAHAEDLLQGGDHVILEEGIGIASLDPGGAVFILKDAPEFLRLALFRDKLFQLGDLQILAVKTEVVIEHLGKHAQHGGFVLVDGALDIDVEEDGIRMALGSPVDEHEGGGIIRKLLAEALNGLHTVHFPVLQQVGEHFQEVRFTAAEEAGDPDADIRRLFAEGFVIVVEEGDEVLLQFPGDDVFFQFLNQNCRLILIDLDDTVNLTINVVPEHRLNSHTASPSLQRIERPVIGVGFQFVEENHIVPVKGARIHDQHRNIREIRLHRLQQGMDPDEGERLADTGDEDHVTRLMRRILHLADEGGVAGHALHLVKDKLLSLLLFLLGNAVGDALVITDGEEDMIEIVFDQAAVQVLIAHQLFREMADDHLVFWVIAEDADIHFV